MSLMSILSIFVVEFVVELIAVVDVVGFSDVLLQVGSTLGDAFT